MSKKPNPNEEIQGYIDGELDGEALKRFEERMASDDGLKRAVASEQALAKAVRGAVEPEPAPEALRTNVLDLIRSEWGEEAESPGTATEAPAPASASASARIRRPAPHTETHTDTRTAARRRPTPMLIRIGSLAAALLLVVAGISYFGGGSGDPLSLPPLIRDSVRLFDEALVSSVQAAETPEIPAFSNLEFERVFCKGKARDGKLNPCILYKRSDDGRVGYFRLDDRLARSKYVKYGPRTASFDGYTVVCSGTPDALHLWIAKEVTVEELWKLVEESGDRKHSDDGDIIIDVKEMDCTNCADQVIAAVKATGIPVRHFWCAVKNRKVHLWIDDRENAAAHRETIVKALTGIEFDNQ